MGLRYLIEPKYKKSTYEKEEWHNKLKNGKNVVIHITTFYRCGTFTALLSKNDVKEIEHLENVIINNYDDFEMIDMIDGCSMYIEIDNEELYTSDEINEINKLIYCYDESNCEYDESNFDIYEFENKGWECYDCEYGINGGCFIESES